MRSKSFLAVGVSALALMTACSDDETVTSDDVYAAPVADYDAAADAALWDSTIYDPFLFAAIVQVNPVDGGNVDATVPPDAGTGGGTPPPPNTVRFPRPVSGLLATWGAVVRPDCVPSIPVTDNDQDGIPASFTATYDCSNQVSGNRTSTVRGTVSVTDTDDSSKVGGLSVTFTDFVVTVAITNGDTRSRTLNGSIVMVPAAAGTFQTTRNLTVAFDFSDSSGNRVAGTDVSNVQATYTPDPGLSDPFASGTVNLTGQETLTRNFKDSNQSRVITRTTSPPLHWNRSCRAQTATASGFDSGTLIYTDDKGGSFQLEFSGCGSPTITSSG